MTPPTHSAHRSTPRWIPVVDHRGTDALQFIDEFWRTYRRRALLIAGAGFDPRAVRVTELLAHAMADRLTAVFLQEERPTPDAALILRATANLARLRVAVPTCLVETIPVFAIDNAVIGGREAAKIAAALPLDDVDDIIIDFSALSIGISFPLTAVLLERARRTGKDLHALVIADASIDAAISPLPGEAALPVHGFQGRWRLDEAERSARLWLPQLAHSQQTLLDRIFREVQPHNICPILPFPAGDPRRGDLLIEEYLSEFESTWEIDARSIIYAAEDNPLDVYRTILQIDDARTTVFEGDGGSVSILSPVGSKVLALGALMAAIERRFPVVHVEAVGYKVDADALDRFSLEGGELAHVWLAGTPYAPPPPRGTKP